MSTPSCEYAQADRDGDQVLEYAQKIVSAPGKQDGLYWAAEGDAELSPLGPLVAEADAYTKDYYKRGEPYHGYYFKILTRQGDNPPGGKYDYVINGNMIAGFAMVAWPADYGHSGVMTLGVSHQGKVYEKDLGEETETARSPDHHLQSRRGLGRSYRRGLSLPDRLAPALVADTAAGFLKARAKRAESHGSDGCA